MKKMILLACIIGVLLVACQPQTLYVEVTRLVSPPDATVTPIANTTPVTAATAVPLEVTRVVPLEVTRVVTEEVAVEVTKAPLGTLARPIQLLFPPTYNSAIVMNRGQVLADALTAATGLQFTVGVMDSEAALIALMCDAPMETVGVLSALGYVVANEQCGVQLGNTAVSRDGRTWQTGMIVTRRDSGILTLEDLADKSWAVPDMHSLPNFLYFQAALMDAGIAPGEIVPVQGDNSAMLSVFNGEVDFATATYIPPILPFEEREWVYGEDSPELWRILGVSPRTRSGCQDGRTYACVRIPGKTNQPVEIYHINRLRDGEGYIRLHLHEEAASERLRFYGCGGDGTLNEVVNGCHGFSGVEVGMVPMEQAMISFVTLVPSPISMISKDKAQCCFKKVWI
ncbi:MAG: PhnD/SsuA/transferrin family substrate-binding protein [Chloroflexota bacterium]